MKQSTLQLLATSLSVTHTQTHTQSWLGLPWFPTAKLPVVSSAEIHIPERLPPRNCGPVVSLEAAVILVVPTSQILL